MRRPVITAEERAALDEDQATIRRLEDPEWLGYDFENHRWQDLEVGREPLRLLRVLIVAGASPNFASEAMEVSLREYVFVQKEHIAVDAPRRSLFSLDDAAAHQMTEGRLVQRQRRDDKSPVPAATPRRSQFRGAHRWMGWMPCRGREGLYVRWSVHLPQTFLSTLTPTYTHMTIARRRDGGRGSQSGRPGGVA